MLGIALGVLSAGAKFAQGQAAANAANEQSMRAYAQQLRIREQNWKNTQAVYANKLAMHGEEMKAADKAATRAYGAEQLRQSQAMDQAVFADRKLTMAMAKAGGRASAAGRTGLSATRADVNTQGAVVRGQAMIAKNLLSGSIAGDYRNMGIQDQHQSARNRSYSNVAIAPIPGPAPIAPMMQSGPSPLGLALGIGNAVVSNLPAPEPGADLPNPQIG